MPRVKAALTSVDTKRPKLADVIEKLQWVKHHSWGTTSDFFNQWGKARKLLYKTLEWETVSKLVFKRSRWVCESCKKRKAKEIHHRIRVYDNPALICTLSNLLHVCDPCHKAAHPTPVHSA